MGEEPFILYSNRNIMCYPTIEYYINGTRHLNICRHVADQFEAMAMKQKMKIERTSFMLSIIQTEDSTLW